MARCVDSLVANLSAHDRIVELTVHDDGRDLDARRALRSHLVGVQQRWGGALRYAGFDEKVAFAARLVEASKGAISRDTVDFALFGVRGASTTIGANRNGFLLDAMDSTALVVDDDVIARLGPIPGSGPGVRARSVSEPAEWWLFDDREAALAAVTLEDADVLAIHEGVLGHTLAEDPGARVLVTSPGLVGDAATTTPLPTLRMSASSRARFVDDPERYARLRTTREVLQGPTVTTVTAVPALMLPFAAVDYHAPLPPFLPVLRNEDRVFAATLVRARPDARIATLPWAVVHAPDVRPTFAETAIWERIANAYGAQVIDGIVLLAPPAPNTPLSWMRRLGEELRRLAARPNPDRIAFVDALLRERQKRHSAELTAYVEQHQHQPRHWALDIERCIERLEARRRLADPLIPTDLAFLDADPAMATARLLERVGALFHEWPAIVSVARTLRDAGLRLSVGV